MAESLSSLSLRQALEGLVIGGTYIAFSAGLITFNKYMLQEGNFPYALHLTVLHMTTATAYSACLYFFVPSIYPTMTASLEKKATTLKYIAPLSIMFAFALWASNVAYQFCSVAFLQFCKEGNIAVMFFMSCAAGRQTFSWQKFAILVVVMAGCALCAEGEINFVWVGFLLQIGSQISECSKNLIGEVVMSGAGMKLDALTFVAWQAPCSLMPLLMAMAFLPTDGIFDALKANWALLLANATVAFLLNVLIAVTLKRLSALAFVIIGLAKDIVIVYASSVIFGDPISETQRVGFMISLAGMALWAKMKLMEQSEAVKEKAEHDDAQDEEKQALLSKQEKQAGQALLTKQKA